MISDFSPDELKEYLAATEYFAMYLSCSPGEKSYPSDRLKHGIWTHFLLQIPGQLWRLMRRKRSQDAA